MPVREDLSPQKITTVGEVLVEIVAQEVGDGFKDQQVFVGPFASGAPAIFIDQVARLGLPAAIVACVGDDDFGRLNIDRLAKDGVDTRAISRHPELPTGIAFVRYRPDGQRDFLYSIEGSAAAQVSTESLDRVVRETRHFHVTGLSLVFDKVAEFASAALPAIKAAGGSISFDPNIRKEMLARPDMTARLHQVLGLCDLFLPSSGELSLFSHAREEETAIADLLARGISEIVLKQGAAGASYFSASERQHFPGFPVEEIDPTGAGDCFSATFVACRLLGKSVRDSLAWTYQDVLALAAAAERARSPLIIQTSGTCIRHNGLSFAFHMVENGVKDATVPVVIHLDHDEEFRLIFDAIYMGYDSVMYDGSKLPIAENIENTSIVKAVAEACGVSVEAEIDHVLKGENDTEVLTTPDEARQFVSETKVDALVVAVGTRHGMQTQDAPLRFDVLEALSAAVDTPLVLHGSSGVSDTDMQAVARSVICKVNIATRLRRVFIRALADTVPVYKGSDHIALITQAHEATIAEAMQIMSLLGSANRA